jgi:hypothetical protein
VREGERAEAEAEAGAQGHILPHAHNCAACAAFCQTIVPLACSGSSGRVAAGGGGGTGKIVCYLLCWRCAPTPLLPPFDAPGAGRFAGVPPQNQLLGDCSSKTRPLAISKLLLSGRSNIRQQTHRAGQGGDLGGPCAPTPLLAPPTRLFGLRRASRLCIAAVT